MIDAKLIKRLRQFNKTPHGAAFFEWLEGWQEESLSGNDIYHEKEYGCIATEVQDVADIEIGELNLSRPDVVRIFQRLDQDGIGQFLIGRRGWQSRLVWNFEPFSVAICARGKSDAILPVEERHRLDVEADFSSTATLRTAPVRVPERGTKTHRHWLREDYEVAITLPADLGPDEAVSLVRFIQSIRTTKPEITNE